MLLAGYFPAVIAFTPSLTGVASRANMFAIFGGTLALASVIALIAILVTANRSQMRIVVLSVLIPLLLVGVTQQIWNQNEARLAWMEQKHFWRALMQALPNLKDGTTLIVVKPHKILDRPFQRLPITMEWEVTAGLQVLYNNPSLRGMLYTPGQIQVPGDARLNPDGVQSFYSNSRIPYDQVVFVYYLPGAKEVRAIDRIDSGDSGRIPGSRIWPPKAYPARSSAIYAVSQPGSTIKGSPALRVMEQTRQNPATTLENLW